MSELKTEEPRHVISMLVDNEPGVLSRVAGLFSGRGFNIESLAVAPTIDPLVSRITVMVPGDEVILEQITKQVHKLVNVHKVSDLTSAPHVQRELALVRVNAQGEHRAEILRIVDIFRGKIVDVSPQDYTIELTGDQDKIEAMLSLLEKMGVIEIARSGVVALQRSKKGVK